jgi:hypothetical protein
MTIKNVNPEKTHIDDIIQERFESNLSSISNKLKFKLDMPDKITQNFEKYFDNVQKRY